MEQQIAGDLEEEVAEIEDARAEPEHRVAEAAVRQHLQLGEADVHAVEPGEHEQQDQDREEPGRNPGVDRLDVGATSGVRHTVCGCGRLSAAVRTPARKFAERARTASIVA